MSQIKALLTFIPDHEEKASGKQDILSPTLVPNGCGKNLCLWQFKTQHSCEEEKQEGSQTAIDLEVFC